jgi:hypothetical protein
MPVACDGGDGACWKNEDCAAGSYCATPDGCGTVGTCTAMPDVCPQYCAYPELCGCDGQTYCNDCMAAAAGTSVSSDPTWCGGPSDGGATCVTDSDCGGCPARCISGQCVETEIPCAIDGGQAPQYFWYHTCGYPVCQYVEDAGPPAPDNCPAIGTACSNPGDTCGTASASNCGVIEICADHDPSRGPCPR